MYEKTKEHFTKLKDAAKNINTLLKTYSDKLEFTGFSGIEPYLSNIITTNLKYVDTNTKEVYIFPSKIDYEFLFNLYLQIMVIYNKLAEIMQIFLQNKVDLSRQGSYTSTGTSLTMTYIQDLNNTLTQIESSFLKFATNIKSVDLLHYIVDDILNDIQTIEQKQIEELNKIYIKYVKENNGNLVVDLYTHILHEILIAKKDHKDIIKYVNNFIEELKTDVLDVPKISDHNKINTVQRLIQMSNLVPVSISKPIDEIFADLNLKYNDKKSLRDNLLASVKLLSKDKNICFIVIHKIIKKPIEHNIWTLIDEEYLNAHKLNQPAEIGINAKYLERGATIKYIPIEKKAKDNIEIVGEFPKDSDMLTDNAFFILESLNGNLYRQLKPWPFENYISIPASWYQNITNLEKCPSKRISGYNDILNTEILKHVHQPYLTINTMNSEEIQKPPAYWKSLKDRIKKHIIDDIIKIYINNFIDNANKLSIENINKIISDEVIYRQALKHITDNIILDNVANLESKLTTDLTKIFQTELILSYFYDLSIIERNLKRDTDNLYKKEYESKLIAHLNAKSESKALYVKNKLIDILNLVFDEVLERFINKKSSIYLSIEKKFNVLKSVWIDKKIT